MTIKKFLVWGDDEGDAFGRCERRIAASSHKEAAEKWAQRDDADSADYTIVGGEPETVCVQALGTVAVRRYSVRGETIAVYYARRLDDASRR